jgi:hypothetical protein
VQTPCEQVDPSEQQALATFSHAAEEIRFFKGQQWHVTNYALIAYAALAAAPEWMEAWKASANLYCAIAVVVTALSAGLVLVALEIALNKERKRMEAVRLKLLLIREIHRKSKPAWRWVVTVVLLPTVLGGAALAIWINFSRIPWVVACISQSASGGSWPAS